MYRCYQKCWVWWVENTEEEATQAEALYSLIVTFDLSVTHIRHWWLR